MKIKNIHIFGGGTVAHISNHFAVCAPAYGITAETLESLCKKRFNKIDGYEGNYAVAKKLDNEFYALIYGGRG